MNKKNSIINIENTKNSLVYKKTNYQILDSIADWIRVIDVEGYVIYANQSMKDKLGNHIVGKRWHEVISNPPSYNNFTTKRSISTGEVIEEVMIDGELYSVKSSPLIDTKGNPVAFVEVFRNITLERKLEDELIKKNQKMKNDLELSKEFQGKILPKKQVIGNVKLDYIYKTSQSLFADIFDIYSIDKENIGIYLSDVSIKGVSSVLMTMFIRQTMRLIKYDSKDPSLILKELHKKFLKLELEKTYYFTMIFGIFNTRTKKFKYVNAGHNCKPIRFNIDREIIQSMEVKDFPISSLLKEISLRESELQIYPGDRILFYTDGLKQSNCQLEGKIVLEKLKDLISREPLENLKTIEDEMLKCGLDLRKDVFLLILLEILEDR